MNQKGFIALPLVLTMAVNFWPFGRPSEPSPTPPPAVIQQIQTPQEKEDLQKRLEKYLTVEAALLGISDEMSLYFKDFNLTKEIAIQPSKSWIPASTIKAYVVLEAFRQRRLGMIDFDQNVTIQAQNVVPTELETDECPRLREDTVVTVKQLVDCMVIQSDNTAYNTLLDVLDRRNINATLRDLGFTETVVGEKLNLDDQQFAEDLKVPGRQSNTTTAKDYASLFDLLYVHKIPQTDEILAIFKRQKINTMIPAYLPQQVEVAHKTGDWAPLYHDGGVVYKPNDPFILTIFTNSNNPSVLAQLARVAYYQDASVVGADIPRQTKTTGFDEQNNEEGNVYSLALPENTKVLAAETGEKFPAVTAQDLGITLQDLAIDQQDIKKIGDARIVPGSPLYVLKQQYEFVKSAFYQITNRPIEGVLSRTTDQLSEAKTFLKSGNFTQGEQILTQSEVSLKQAVSDASKDGDKEARFAQIKNVNDLHYAMLADVAKTVTPSKKEQFVDLVYNFYQKNNQEVKPIVKNSLLANPLRQQPVVGTVKDVKGNTVTVQFASGQEKQVVMNSLTPVRQFNQQTVDPNTSSIKTGSKIAVIGQTTNEGTIVPQFVLRDVPREVPDKHEGVVIEINPNKKTLEIINEAGKKETIQVENTTILQGKSTGVSLEGIKAGSYIKVFGEQVAPTTAGTAGPQGTTTPAPSGGTPVQGAPTGNPSGVVSPSVSPTTKVGVPISLTPTAQPGLIQIVSPAVGTRGVAPSIGGKQVPTLGRPSVPEPVIRATTVTVTKNSSGKNEKVTPSAKSAPKNGGRPAPPKRKSDRGGSIFSYLTFIYQILKPWLRWIV